MKETRWPHGTWFMRKSWDKKELGLVQLFRQQGLQSWANDKDTQNGGGGWLIRNSWTMFASRSILASVQIRGMSTFSLTFLVPIHVT
jgi:hypothetical protein